MQKSQKQSKKQSKTGFTYSVPHQKLGQYPITVNKKSYIGILAEVKVNDLKADPSNMRLEGLEGGDDFKFSDNSQKLLVDYLNGDVADNKDSKNLGKHAANLSSAIELHGGQNEPWYVHFESGHAVVKEGNRRYAIAVKSGIIKVIVIILPDEMSSEEVDLLIDSKHVAGPLAWSSYVTSKRCYDLLRQGMDIETITKHLGFSSLREAKKYTHSYVWFKQSGLTDINEWSKFHHGYVPALVNHFGYNEDSQTFSDAARTASNSDSPTPEEVDDIAGRKTDFKWFCDLINHQKLTDCRQSDGLISPLIRFADEPYSQRTFQILHGKKDEKNTAKKAWDYFKNAREHDGLSQKADALSDEFTTLLNSTSRLSQYVPFSGDNGTRNQLLDASLGRLAATTKRLMERLDEMRKVSSSKSEAA